MIMMMVMVVMVVVLKGEGKYVKLNNNDKNIYSIPPKTHLKSHKNTL